MNTIYGESPEIQVGDSYSRNGGISLFSAGDDEGGETITGGSGGSGSYPTSSRIYWSITRVPDSAQPDGYIYSGGITGVSCFTDMPQSPFADPRFDEPSKIWSIAETNNNLNIIFDEWNSDTSPDGEEKRAYFMYYLSVHARGCSMTTTGG